MGAADRWLPTAWALLLTLLLLGPALAPGYLLSYDMVWVPDLTLRPETLGLGSGLPRAVPADAVVAVLDEVLPAMLLQKAVLAGALVAAGAGTATLLGGAGVLARMAGVTIAIWNPYVAERLVLGHWTMLVAYGALPWLLLLAARAARTRRVPWPLLVLMPVASLSPSAGIMSAVAVLAAGLSFQRSTDLRLVAVTVAANAPWVVSGLLHAPQAVSDPRAAELFALRGAWLPAPLEALALGGVWNSEVVPAGREGWTAGLGLVLLLGLAGVGLRAWWREASSQTRRGLWLCWVVGLGLALLTWGAPEAVAWLSAEVPGGGLLRDGSRLLALCFPLVAVLVGHGVSRAAAWVEPRWQRVVLGGALVLLPIAQAPEVAWGAGLPRPTEFPDSWYDAAPAVAQDDGPLLLLPLSSYRQPAWNGHAKVLDPAARFFDAPSIASDELSVDGLLLAGEDPRVRRARTALQEESPRSRAAALTGAGVQRVLLVRDVPGETPTIAGRRVVDTDELLLLDLDPHSSAGSVVPRSWAVGMVTAWMAYLALLLLGLLGGVGETLRRRRAP